LIAIARELFFVAVDDELERSCVADEDDVGVGVAGGEYLALAGIGLLVDETTVAKL